MLTEKFLEKWVQILVPEIYGPNKNPKSGKVLLGIYIVDSEKMESAKELWYKDSNEEVDLLGQLVDMGKLMSLTGHANETLDNRFVIRLNEAQSEISGIFALAHEIGHLYGILNEPEQHNESPDDYADIYAYKLIKEKVTDTELRFRIFVEAFSQQRV